MPDREQAIILSTINGSTPPIPIYILNIFSTINYSTLPIQIYILNILSITNGSKPPIPIRHIKNKKLFKKLTPAKLHEVR